MLRSAVSHLVMWPGPLRSGQWSVVLGRTAKILDRQKNIDNRPGQCCWTSFQTVQLMHRIPWVSMVLAYLPSSLISQFFEGWPIRALCPQHILHEILKCQRHSITFRKIKMLQNDCQWTSRRIQCTINYENIWAVWSRDVVSNYL